MTTLNSVPTSNSGDTAPEPKTYANFRDFNNATFEGRVLHTEIKTGQYGEFVEVTVATTLKDGDAGVAIRFVSSNGVLKLAKSGHLMTGCRVHITGTISGFESHYVNKDGVIVQLQRPRLNLTGVQLMLGAKPRTPQGNVAA